MVYERQIATAKRLIAKYGQVCTWREPGATTGTANKPIPGTPVDYTVQIAFLPNDSRESLHSLLSMMTGTEVPTSGVQGLMAAVPFTPTLRGVVFRGPTATTNPLHLMDKNGIEVLNVNGEIILYTLRFGQ